MSNTRFTVVYPADLNEPIVDTEGDILKLADWTSACGRVLDLDVCVAGKRPRTARLDEASVRVLRDRLTAWLDAPSATVEVP